MARWEEAYDALLDAYLYTSSERGQEYLDGWLSSVEEELPGQTKPGGVHYGVQSALPRYLFNAEPVWVDPDMMTLWEAALPSFTEEAIEPTDLPTDVGFVWLPRPFYQEDLRGLRSCARAILWARVSGHWSTDGVATDRDGVVFGIFHRIGDSDDYDDASTRYRHGVRTGDLTLDWWYMAPFGFHSHKANHRLSAVKPIQCLLRLMQQTIATRDLERPSSPFRGRWKHAGMMEKQVVVVRLRRPAPKEPGEHRSVDWDHRWIVSGHWRNQWFPSLDMHRQIWISAHVKGPEDKELLVRKARVWELVT